MAIRQIIFRHAAKTWLALFEDYYIDPEGAKGQPERTEENHRLTWSIRKYQAGVQDLCLSGNWSQERGAYSIDRMRERLPRGLVSAAFRHERHAVEVPKTDRSRCCPGVVVSRKGVTSGYFCEICKVLKSTNAEVLAKIAERRQRLVDEDNGAD